jgi:hypothetical protein
MREAVCILPLRRDADNQHGGFHSLEDGFCGFSTTDEARSFAACQADS